MENEIFDKAVNLIKEQKGYSSSQNISDYWFNNKNVLSNKVNEKWPWYSQTFDLLIRWHSDIGCECRKQIINFIKDIQIKASNERSILMRTSGIASFNLAVIDFDQFRFTYKDKQYNLSEFTGSFLSEFAASFRTSQFTGLHDLQGIDLSNIDIRDCEIRHCFFANANFSNSYIQQTKFHHCIFTAANFDNASLVNIRYDDTTSFGNISAKNTFFNALDLKKFSTPKNIITPNYFWLIKEFFRDHSKTNLIDRNKNHTVFWEVGTEKNTDIKNTEFISYVNWFQYVTKKIYNNRHESFINKIKFFLALVTTKYWTSCKVLILFSVAVNLIYSVIYYLLRSGFTYNTNVIKGDLYDYIYFSFVTFTTLGFGDITPINHINQFVVMSEVGLGYTILGAFVFLLSKKISTLQL